jgi:hypothetical protein
MRTFLAGGLGLVLGFWTGAANAQETRSEFAPVHPSAIACPVAAGSESAPLVTLGRPIAIPPSNQSRPPTIADQQVTPASFSLPHIGLPQRFTRAQSTESPQRLLTGPVLDDLSQPEPTTPPSSGKTSPEVLGRPRLVPVPQTGGPTQVPGPMVEHSVSSPISSCDDCGSCCDACPWPRCWSIFRGWDDFPQDANRFWFRGEYLLWWLKESPVPALVTTSPPGTPRALAGVLGAPGTVILFDGDENPERSGGRFTIGFWFDSEQTIGLESTTMFLAERSIVFRDGSGGTPILARPFFNVVSGTQASELVAYPGVLAGNVVASSANQLWSTELNLRGNFWRGCFWHLDWLAGVRFLGFDEKLGISEGLTVPAGAGSLTGSNIVVQDSFGTHNQFVGGQVGLEVGFRRGRWSVDLLGKVALGNTHEEANINGSTQFAVPGLPVNVQPGGLYALPSNIGEYTRDRFAVVPEAGVLIGYQITRTLRAIVGYTFLYNSAVLRPGNQIDRGINVSQLPSQVGPGTLVGPARPAPILHGSDFWAQGLSFGLELRY